MKAERNAPPRAPETSKSGTSAPRKASTNRRWVLCDTCTSDLFTLDQIWDVLRHIPSEVICGIHECEYAEIEETP